MTAIRDLRLRLVIAFLLVLATSQIATLPPAVAMLCLALALAAMGGSYRRIWHRLIHIEGFVALMAVALPFTIPGEPLFHIGPFTASAEGATRAILLALKISASGIIILSLLGDEEPERLGGALHDLRMPEALVKILMLAVRYLSLIRGEARRLTEAMKARAFTPRSNRHTWKSYGNLIGMILLRTMDRAVRVEEAMRCRGYSGRMPHAAIAAPRAADWAASATLVVIAILALLWDRS